jgi:hypothetical protein
MFDPGWPPMYKLSLQAPSRHPNGTSRCCPGFHSSAGSPASADGQQQSLLPHTYAEVGML